jgi:hypothetical protein
MYRKCDCSAQGLDLAIQTEIDDTLVTLDQTCALGKAIVSGHFDQFPERRVFCQFAQRGFGVGKFFRTHSDSDIAYILHRLSTWR